MASSEGYDPGDNGGLHAAQDGGRDMRQPLSPLCDNQPLPARKQEESTMRKDSGSTTTGTTRLARKRKSSQAIHHDGPREKTRPPVDVDEDPYLLQPGHDMVAIGEAITALLQKRRGQAAWRAMWTGEEALSVIEQLQTGDCLDPAVALRAFLLSVIGPAIEAALVEDKLESIRFTNAWDASLFALARPGQSRWPEYGEVVTLVLGLCDQRGLSLSLWAALEDGGGADGDEDASSCYTIRCLQAIEWLAQKMDAPAGHFYININPGRCAQELVTGTGRKGRRCMACKLPPGVLELSRAFRGFVFGMLHAMKVKLRHACAITSLEPLGPLSLPDTPRLPGAVALVRGVSVATTIHPSKILDLAHRFHSPSFTTTALAHLVGSVAPSLTTGIEFGQIIKEMMSCGGLPDIHQSLNRRMMAGPIASLGLDSLDVVGGVRRVGSRDAPKRLGREELDALLMGDEEEGHCHCGHHAEELLRHGRDGRLHPTLTGREIMAMLQARWEDSMEDDEALWEDDEALWEAARSLAVDELEAIRGLSSAHHGMLLASWKGHFLHLRRQAQARACGEPTPCQAFGTLETGIVLIETWTRGEEDGEDPDNPLRRTSTGWASQTFAWHAATWGSATEEEPAARDVKTTAKLYTSLPRVEAALGDKLVLTLYGINDGGGLTSNGHRCPSYEACLKSAEWLLGKVLVDPEVLPFVRHVVWYGQPPVRTPKDKAALDPLSILMQQADLRRITTVDVTEAGRRASRGVLAPELSCQRLLVNMGDYEQPCMMFFWSRGGQGLMQGSSVASLGMDEGKMAVMREMPAPILLHRYAADGLVLRNLLEVLHGAHPSSLGDLALPTFWAQPLAVVRSSVGATGGSTNKMGQDGRMTNDKKADGGQSNRDSATEYGATEELHVQVMAPGKLGWLNAATSKDGTVLKKKGGAIFVSRSVAAPPQSKSNFTLNTLVDHYLDMGKGYEAGVHIRVSVRYVGENTWTELVWDPTKKRRGRGADRQGQ